MYEKKCNEPKKVDIRTVQVMKQQQHHAVVRALVVGLLLVVTACGGVPVGTRHELRIGTQLGVVIDQQQRVVDVEAKGAAERAGIQVGDLLLDLAYIPPTTLEPSVDANPEATEVVAHMNNEVEQDDADRAISESRVSPLPSPVPANTPRLEDILGTNPVQFTDVDGIRKLIVRGVPLKLRLERETEVIEIVITPSRPIFHPIDSGVPTSTPVPSEFMYY